jgi:hypothetical protein
MIVVVSLSIFGGILPIVKWKFGGSFDWVFFIFFVFISIVVFPIIVRSALDGSEEHFQNAVVLVAVSFFISLHIASLISTPPSWQIRSFKAMVFVLISLCVIAPSQFIQILKAGLRAYGVGGGVPVVVESQTDHKTPIQGELLLLSPNFAYLKPKGEKNVLIIPISSVWSLGIKK